MSTNPISKSDAIKLVRTRMNDLLMRASIDSELRSRLVTDPRRTASAFFGVELPESFRLAFVENKADATFVLPEPAAPQPELSDRELEAVAGGCTLATGAAIVASAAGAAALYDVIEDRLCDTSCFDGDEKKDETSASNS